MYILRLERQIMQNYLYTFGFMFTIIMQPSNDKHVPLSLPVIVMVLKISTELVYILGSYKETVIFANVNIYMYLYKHFFCC